MYLLRTYIFFLFDCLWTSTAYFFVSTVSNLFKWLNIYLLLSEQIEIYKGPLISFSVRTYIFLFIWLPNFYSVFFVVSTVSNLFKWLTQYSAALLLHQGLFSRSDLGEHKNMHTCVNNLTYLIHLRGHSITTYVIWKIHNGMAAPSKSAVWSIWLGRRLE